MKPKIVNPDQLPPLRNTDPILKFVEYHAIKRFFANGCDVLMQQGYPELFARLPDLDFDFILVDEDDYRHRAMELLRNAAFDNTVPAFALASVHRFLDSEGDIVPDRGDDEVIESPETVKSSSKITAPQLRKIRKDQKSIARENFQRKRLGNDALVSKDLYSRAREAVSALLDKGGNREDVRRLYHDLVATEDLTESQRNTLLNEIMLPHFYKLNVKNRLVFDLLDQPSAKNKTILYFWFQLSRKFEVGVEFPLSDGEITRLAKCSYADVSKYKEAMRTHGILKLVNKGVKGANSKKASTYRLLVKAEF